MREPVDPIPWCKIASKFWGYHTGHHMAFRFVGITAMARIVKPSSCSQTWTLVSPFHGIPNQP
jgi:hypothetical protein